MGYGRITDAKKQNPRRDKKKTRLHGCRPWPILTEYYRTSFVPMNKYGIAQNSTPHAKDDYHSRFLYVSSESATTHGTWTNAPSYKLPNPAGASSCKTKGR